MPAPDQVTLPTPCAHGCGRCADVGLVAAPPQACARHEPTPLCLHRANASWHSMVPVRRTTVMRNSGRADGLDFAQLGVSYVATIQYVLIQQYNTIRIIQQYSKIRRVLSYPGHGSPPPSPPPPSPPPPPAPAFGPAGVGRRRNRGTITTTGGGGGVGGRGGGGGSVVNGRGSRRWPAISRTTSARSTWHIEPGSLSPIHSSRARGH